MSLIIYSAPSLAQELEVPEGYVLIKEETLLTFISEPDDSFDRALESMSAVDYIEAADEIRRGAAFTRIAARQLFENANRKIIRGLAEDLETLADQVETEEIDSASILRNLFARVDHTLATIYISEADDALTRDEPEDITLNAAAAAYRIESAAILLKHNLNGATKKAIAEAKDALDQEEVELDLVADWYKSYRESLREIEPKISR